MIFRVGSCPSAKAGKATDEQIDFRLRGGTVMIRRRVSPLSTSVSAYAIASKCQFSCKCLPPETIGKAPLNETIEIASERCFKQGTTSGDRQRGDCFVGVK